jgi:probable rRNA maturation factor
MKLLIDDESGALALDESLLMRAAALSVRTEAVDVDDVEVSVLVVSPEEMRTLNLEHRGKDETTDVLSFPQYEDSEQVRAVAEQQRGFSLGDIVINAQAAEAQAAEYGHSKERETAYLFVHGMLHLLGHDHEDEADKAVMRHTEEFVLSAIGLGSGGEGECPSYREDV